MNVIPLLVWRYFLEGLTKYTQNRKLIIIDRIKTYSNKNDCIQRRYLYLTIFLCKNSIVLIHCVHLFRHGMDSVRLFVKMAGYIIPKFTGKLMQKNYQQMKTAKVQLATDWKDRYIPSLHILIFE